MTHAEDSKLRRANAAANGLCISCHTREHEPGYRKCYECRMHEHKRRAEAKDAGLCSKCLKHPKRADRLTCQQCRDKCAKRSKSQISIRNASTGYVKALRKLESITAGCRDYIDSPGQMREVRKQVQAAVRELFAAVERRA